MERKNQELSEVIRQRLNRVGGIDSHGNDNRFKWQLATWFGGGILESSNDLRLRIIGSKLRRGAENSFADYVGEVVSESVRSAFMSYDAV